MVIFQSTLLLNSQWNLTISLFEKSGFKFEIEMDLTMKTPHKDFVKKVPHIHLLNMPQI